MGNGCAHCFKKQAHRGDDYGVSVNSNNNGNSNVYSLSVYKARGNEQYAQVARFDGREYLPQIQQNARK